SAPALEPLEGRMLLTSSLVNGGFDQGADGLEGWQLTDASLVTVNQDHRAVVRESATEVEVDLFQDFGIPSDATTLAFTLSDMTFDNLLAPDETPDAFGVSLLDSSTLSPLVGTVDEFTDSYYIRDLEQGVTQGMAAAGVVITPGPEPG